jgi:hypothetical protein
MSGCNQLGSKLVMRISNSASEYLSLELVGPALRIP